MIIKMKKVSIMCLEADKQSVLESVAALGAVHMAVKKKADSEERAHMREKLAKIKRASTILASMPSEKDCQHKHMDSMSAEKVLDRTLMMYDHLSAMKAKLKELRKEEEVLAPWGDFSHKLVEELEAKGIHLSFCVGGKAQVDNPPEGAAVEVVSHHQGKYYYVLVSDKKLSDKKIKTAPLFSKNVTLAKIREEMQTCEGEIAETTVILEHLKPMVPALEKMGEALQEEYDLVSARDGMGDFESIAYIQGYVPDTSVRELSECAKAHHWALLVEEPAKDDIVPTCIQAPKGFKISAPILDFIGVLPGYKEWDISVFLLLFFTIFFAMIINDGGYGVLFLGLGLGSLFMAKSPKAKNIGMLFSVLGVASLGWGMLTGNFFGIPKHFLPGFLHGLKCFDMEHGGDGFKNVQYCCFLLASIHLASARLYKAWLNFGGKKMLGQIGWAMLLFANFFAAVELIVYKGSFPSWALYLYAIGLALIVIFYVHWTDIGEVFMFPLHLMESFVDVLSYIRLFALGVAAFYIAESFNNMGVLLMNAVPPSLSVVGVVAASVIFVLGHALNIGLGIIAVLVHDIRLNTLEFSNHMGLQWTGIKYNPLKKQIKKEC